MFDNEENIPKKKILFAMYCLYNGGAERSLVNLLNEIDYSKYEVDLQLFTNGGMFISQLPKQVKLLPEQEFLRDVYSLDRKLTKGAFTHWLYKVVATGCSYIVEKKEKYRKAFRYLYFYDKKCRDLEKEYDTAIAYISGDVMFFLNRHVKAKRKIVFVHNDYRTAEHAKKYEEKYFADMDAIVTISEICADVLRKEFPQFASKVYCVPNITSSSAVRNRATCGEIPEIEDYKSAFKIVSVGRLNEQKGFDMAIDAARLLKQRGIEFSWYVLGNGELKESLEKQIKENDVEDRFFLLGSKENPYVYMKNADIVAQTSRWEGKSVVLDEAKIIGTPIITTDYPTAKDQILNGHEGIIVGMSADDIADGIQQLIENHALNRHIREYLSSHEYGNAEEVKKYYQLFE